MYWKLKSARHGICAAHLIRDLAAVAAASGQSAWAEGLVRLLVEINAACDTARERGHKAVSSKTRKAFTARYDTLVAQALGANPDPPPKALKAHPSNASPTTWPWPSKPTSSRSWPP
jgi:hypothetical protein